MNKFSKVIAIALAATMVIGSSVTAFAGDNDGSSTGAGTSEGHVEKKATNVVLPTIASDATPFAYTMDPERLIQETVGAKYGSTTEFPAKADDTGVYFNNGKKGGNGDDKDNIVYANESIAQKVTNKSSHNITLTVKAEATTAATDIPLVAKAAIADAAEASLYIGLVVGSETAVEVDEETAATTTVTINGTAANFKTAVNSAGTGYEYRVMTGTEWAVANGKEVGEGKDYADEAAAAAARDATWADTDISLEGSVTSGKAITATTTAPSIKVTWSWVDPTDTVATAIAYTSKNSAGDVTLTFTPGTDAKTLAKTSFKINGVETAAWSSYATNIVFNNDNTITVKAAVFGFSSITGVTTDNKYTFVVVDTDGTSYTTGEVTIQ